MIRGEYSWQGVTNQPKHGLDQRRPRFKSTKVESCPQVGAEGAGYKSSDKKAVNEAALRVCCLLTCVFWCVGLCGAAPLLPQLPPLSLLLFSVPIYARMAGFEGFFAGGSGATSAPDTCHDAIFVCFSTTCGTGRAALNFQCLYNTGRGS